VNEAADFPEGIIHGFVVDGFEHGAGALAGVIFFGLFGIYLI
jgi:hypothetical protein